MHILTDVLQTTLITDDVIVIPTLPYLAFNQTLRPNTGGDCTFVGI